MKIIVYTTPDRLTNFLTGPESDCLLAKLEKNKEFFIPVDVYLGNYFFKKSAKPGFLLVHKYSNPSTGPK